MDSHASTPQSPSFSRMWSPPNIKMFVNSAMLKRNSSSNYALYLCQSFPRHIETVFLHPLSSQRTSTQWEFRRALFLWPLLLCRKQRAFTAQTGSNSCKVPTFACFHRYLKINLHKFGKFEMGLNCKVNCLVCFGHPLKAGLRFYLSNAALVGMLRAKPLTPVCWKYGMQKMLSAMTATESEGLTKKPCLPRTMLRSCKANRHTEVF